MVKQNKITWNEFRIELQEGCYREFIYNKFYIYISSEIKNALSKTKIWIFIVYRHDNNGTDIYSEYRTPELLLQNAHVDGKSLQEIWNEMLECV